MAAVQEEEYTGPAMTAHDWMYVRVGIVLAVLTAVEVGLYYAVKDHGFDKTANVWILLLLAFTKFAVVAAWFMHLKYDHPAFRRLFAGGAVLAGFCYVGVLSAFGTLKAKWSFQWLPYIAFVVVVAILVMRRAGKSSHDETSSDSHPAH